MEIGSRDLGKRGDRGASRREKMEGRQKRVADKLRGEGRAISDLELGENGEVGEGTRFRVSREYTSV